MDPDRLAKKYYGSYAAKYDESREDTPQWVGEQRIVEEYLSRFPAGTTVLDVPVGTGRFLGVYVDRGFRATGLDVSDAMLARANEKRPEASTVRLDQGDIFSTKFADDAFDLAVCIRFMNWVDEDHLARALTELSRVSSGAIIVYIPTYTPVPELLRGLRLGRLARQLKYRLFLARTSSDSVVHGHGAVQRVFRKLDLRVDSMGLIDRQSDRMWQLGVDRHIYLLRVGTRSPGGARDP